MKKIFFIIFLLSFAFRFLLINDSLFHHDSATLARAVENTIQEKKLYADHSQSHLNVLVNVILTLLFRSILSFEFILKLNNIIFTSLTCGFLFLAVSKYSKRKILGTFAALLLSFNPVFLSVSTFPINYGLALLFIVISYYFYLNKKFI